ncbi:MAG: AraC family transcriptional regulator [Comamonas sp.]
MLESLFANIPFDRHRLINTADLEEAQHLIGNVLSPYRLRVVRGQVDHCRLELLSCGAISLIRMRHGYGADISIDPHSGTLDGYYLIVLPTRGNAVFQFGESSFDVSPKSAVMLSPGKRFRFTASNDYEQILLRLERKAIDDAWRRLTSHDEAPFICFEAEIPSQTAGWQALMPMLQWVARCSVPEHGRNGAQTVLLAETEMLLATTLLLHQPHNRTEHLWPAPSPSVPAAVRRAQAYMLEHMNSSLPVGLVASHCGLSVRHLQALFSDECGVSPLQWLRIQRLQAIRHALQADDTHSISETALRFGFTHLGEFSRAYRKAFGETATQTRGGRR